MKRHTSHSETISDFSDEFLIRCPQCSARALVKLTYDSAKASCTHCGYSQQLKGSEIQLATGEAIDRAFKHPLWLQTPCCGETLWAYNEKHLEFLESYVGAELRERVVVKGAPRNATVESRLPEWLKSAKNRAKVLAGLRELRGKLQK